MQPVGVPIRSSFHDLATRQLVGRISDPAEEDAAAHRALVQSLAFSPDGTRLASGSFREVKIWRLQPAKQVPPASGLAAVAATPELLTKIATAGKVKISSSALSSDGKRVVMGCDDGSVRVSDVAALKPIIELRGSATAAKAMADLEWTIAAQTLEQAFQKSEVTRIEAQDKALDVPLGKAKEAIVAMQKVLPENRKLCRRPRMRRWPRRKPLMTRAKFSVSKDAAIEKELKTAQDKLITAKMAEVFALAAVSAAESNVKDAEDEVKRITESKARNAKSVAAANAAMAAAKGKQEKAMADLAAAKLALTKITAKPLAVIC